MKIRNLLLPALLAGAVVITSCSKKDDENTEPQKQTKKVYLLTTQVTNNDVWGTFTDDYTYNSDMQLVEYVSLWGTLGDTLTYSYDESGRVSTINKDGIQYKTYEYLDQVILEMTWADNGNLAATVQYNLNSDGKAIREQDINTSAYTTYEWTDGNMTRKITNYANGSPEIVYYEYNTDVKEPRNDRYTGTLPALTSVNMISKSTDGSTIVYTPNTAGYPTTIVTPTNFGDFTSTCTYETKTVTVK